MVGLLNSFDMNRFLSNTGGIVGATVYFYYTGTTNLAPIYSDKALTIPAANPVTIAQGSLVPILFLDSTIQYRRRIVFSDTTVYDIDPIAIPEGLSALLAATGGAALIGTVQDGTVQQAITNTPKFSDSASYPKGTIGNKLQKIHYVTDAPYNAVGDGITDDRAAFVAADGAGGFTVPPANYLIASTLTLNSHVTFAPGATLVIPNGVIVTFSGGITAPPTQIFNPSGTGIVEFNTKMPPQGYAEWWGALPNNPSAASANLTAINAALVALQKVQLLGEDYWVNGTIVHGVSNHTLAGAAFNYDGVTADEVTRILSTSDSLAILRVGAASFPGSINAMPQGIKVENLYLNRSVGPLISSNCDGLIMQFCRSSVLRNVKSVNSMNSIHFTGCVANYIVECQVNRDTAGTGAGTDTWNGYWVDGNNNIGAAGGNASLYLIRCQAGCNISSLSTTSSSGYYLSSGLYGIQDTFMDWCESVSCYIGKRIEGGSGGNADIHINHSIDDQVYKYGIYVNALNNTGTIDITDPYVGPSSAAQFGIYFNNCLGSINLKGGQLLMGGLSGPQAIAIVGSSGVSIRGTMIVEATAVGVVLSASNNCWIEPVLHNAVATSSSTGVQLVGTCLANHVSPLVYGKSSGFGFGIQVIGTTDARNEYNCSGIDSSCISGGSGNKLVRNGSQITTTGLSGSNLVSGVMT